jgi:hypothetical protein
MTECLLTKPNQPTNQINKNKTKQNKNKAVVWGTELDFG